MTTTKPFPPPGNDQAFWNASALEAGHLWIDLPFFIDPPPPPSSQSDLEVPSLAFYLQHSSKNTKFVFDLGIRKDKENCVSWVGSGVNITNDGEWWQSCEGVFRFFLEVAGFFNLVLYTLLGS